MVPQDTRTFGAGWGSNAPALTTPGLFIWPCCSPVFSSLFLRVSVKLRSSPGAGATWFSQALSSAALKGGQAGQKSTPSGSSPPPPPPALPSKQENSSGASSLGESSLPLLLMAPYWNNPPQVQTICLTEGL